MINKVLDVIQSYFIHWYKLIFCIPYPQLLSIEYQNCYYLLYFLTFFLARGKKDYNQSIFAIITLFNSSFFLFASLRWALCHKGLNLGFKLGRDWFHPKNLLSLVFDPGFSLITYCCELVSFLNHPEVIELYYLSVIQLCHIGNSGDLIGDETLL